MENKITVGGQAVIEGVMMREGNNMALAVRQPNGQIAVQNEELSGLSIRYPIFKKPILRGVVALGEALVYGMKALSTAAQLAGEEDEELTDTQVAFTMLFAILLAVGLFIALPTYAIKFLHSHVTSPVALNALEGIVRLSIFLLYVYLISRMDDIKRVFEYHGAEHKTIHAYEAGVELNVANVQQFSTLHPRCGTSFLLIVMMVSMVVFSFLGWPDIWQRITSRIVLMPLIAGISYEIIRYAGRHAKGRITGMLILPGLLMQKMTTKEPDDSQVEVAIRALKAVLKIPEPADDDEKSIDPDIIGAVSTEEHSTAV